MQISVVEGRQMGLDTCLLKWMSTKTASAIPIFNERSNWCYSSKAEPVWAVPNYLLFKITGVLYKLRGIKLDSRGPLSAKGGPQRSNAS